MATAVGPNLSKLQVADNSSWEYDAPQFFDFTRVGDTQDECLDDSSDYFSVDHESGLCSSINFGAMPGEPTPSLVGNSAAITNFASFAVAASELLPVSLKQDAMTRPTEPILPTTGSSSASSVYISVTSDDFETVATIHNNCDKLDKRLQHLTVNEGPADTMSNPSVDLLQGNQPHLMTDDTTATAVLQTPQRNRAEAAAAHRATNTPASVNKKHDGSGDRAHPRCVDVITSAKKRLSMSVDRGHAKLAKMAAALSGQKQSHKALFSIPAPPGILHTILHCLAHGSADLTSVVGLSDDVSDTLVTPVTDTVPNVAADVAAAVGLLDAGDFVARLTHGNTAAVEQERLNRLVAVPHVGIPFRPLGTTDKRRTAVKPFSFEERNRRMVEAKQQRIEKILEAEKKLREFHAHPFPEIIYFTVPSRAAIAAAAPRTEHARKKDKPDVEVKSVVFKAKPPTVLHRSPFVPHRSMKPLTGSSVVPMLAFHLNTERRAAQRAEWEKWKREKEQKEQELKRDREQQERERRDAELRRMRQATVHRPLPMPHFFKRAANQPAATPATVSASAATVSVADHSTDAASAIEIAAAVN